MKWDAYVVRRTVWVDRGAWARNMQRAAEMRQAALAARVTLRDFQGNARHVTAANAGRFTP